MELNQNLIEKGSFTTWVCLTSYHWDKVRSSNLYQNIARALVLGSEYRSADSFSKISVYYLNGWPSILFAYIQAWLILYIIIHATKLINCHRYNHNRKEGRKKKMF